MKHVSLLLVVVTGSFIGSGSLTYGEQRQEGRVAEKVIAGETQRASQEVSATMPKTIEEFVQTFGTGTVAEISPSVLLDPHAVNTDRDAVIELLQPVKHSVNSGPVTVYAISDQQPDTTGLIAGTAVLLDDGTEIEAGGALLPGDVVQLGAVMNGSNRDVVVEVQGDALVIVPGEVLFTTHDCPKSCSNACGKGFYACCNVVSDCAFCECPPVTSIRNCASGGKGATSCSATAAAN